MPFCDRQLYDQMRGYSIRAMDGWLDLRCGSSQRSAGFTARLLLALTPPADIIYHVAAWERWQWNRSSCPPSCRTSEKRFAICDCKLEFVTSEFNNFVIRLGQWLRRSVPWTLL